MFNVSDAALSVTPAAVKVLVPVLFNVKDVRLLSVNATSVCAAVEESFTIRLVPVSVNAVSVTRPVP